VTAIDNRVQAEKTMQKEIRIVGSLRLWPRELAAEKLDLCEKTLRRMELERRGPPCVRIGRDPETSIEKWIMRSVEKAEAKAAR
jgi:hypothetical protein